ncbi:MAG TPA: hypothetical protein VK193_10345 [Methyloceanibacter sp.]|jgi:hypothetical protein|nr:hypothetical protein [Methyloceanibacter sp.]
MAPMLYWIVYHLDLGRLGLKVLDLAVQSWLNRANKPVAAPVVRRQSLGALTTLHLDPNFGVDERM